MNGSGNGSGNGLIRLVDLEKTYRVGTELVHALRGITLDIGENEYVAIMGPSGSGKSTLLNVLGCLDVPTDGAYYLRGRDVSELSQSRLARIRGRQIGFVFQTFELLPRTTALKNIQLPLMYAQVSRKKQRARAALERIRKAGERYPATQPAAGSRPEAKQAAPRPRAR